MSFNRWLAALLGLTVGASAGLAGIQVSVGSGSQGSYVSGSYVSGGRKPKLSLSFASGYLPNGYAGPMGPYGYGYEPGWSYNPPQWGTIDRWGYSSINQMTVVYLPPPPPPRLIFLHPPPRVVVVEEIIVEVLPRRQPRPVEPEKKPEEKKPEEKKPEKKPDDKLVRPQVPPRPAMPLDDPAAEYDRLIELGKLAFEAQEYGRARDRFRQAIKLSPKQVPGHFLLVQTLFAVGKYHDAVDALHVGLVLKPDWPDAPFRPLELYGEAPAEYAEHLARLEATLAQHPADPVLLFLSAYQMWFDGRKDEALPLLQRALARGADRADVERFLRALPPQPEL